MKSRFHFNNFRDFLEWSADRWVMPGEFKKQLAKKNLHNTIIVMQLVMLYGLLNGIYYVIKYWSSLLENGINSVVWYYITFVALSLVVIFYTSFLIKLDTDKPFFNNSPFLVAYITVAFMVVYNFKYAGQPFNGTILNFCIGIVTVTFFTISPVIFFISLVFLNSHISFFVMKEWGLRALVDYNLFSIMMVALSMFKWRVTKRDLIRNEMLETHKEILKEEIERQTEEIHEQNAELNKQHERIIEIQNNTIISLSNLVENRDSDTGEHIRRTSAYVRLLAQKAAYNNIYADILTPDYIDLLTKAAPMHDIGKIVVPDSVLKKPGKLTEEEFALIKLHTIEGGRIVREIIGSNDDKDYVRIATEVAEGHHEYWNGTGYPNNLSGEAIPLSARIMAIADVYDALVSPRCYKEPFSVRKAFQIIRDESGSHFDPKLVELFCNMEDDIVAVMEKYKEQ